VYSLNCGNLIQSFISENYVPDMDLNFVALCMFYSVKNVHNIVEMWWFQYHKLNRNRHDVMLFDS
jgi:hypothetical protein